MGATGANCTGRDRTDRVAERLRTRARRTASDGLDVVLGIYGSDSGTHYISPHSVLKRPGPRPPTLRDAERDFRRPGGVRAGRPRWAT